MKAYVFADAGKMVWKNVKDPILPEPYGAILKPLIVSPCTSDVHTVFHGSKPKQENHVLGHECVAKIEQLGSGVRDFKVGDIVAVPAATPDWRAVAIQEGNDRHAEDHFAACRLGRTRPGVFAEYFSLPDADTTLAHIPEGVTLEQALMCVDMMATGLTAAEAADINFGDTVCVLGIGAVGLMAIAGANHRGAARIIAVGSRAVCVELAKQYGASEILDYHAGNIAERVLDMTGGIGPDSVIIAGGGDEVFPQAVDMVRYGIGTIVNVNYFGGTGFLGFPKFSGGRGMAGKTIRTEAVKGGRAWIERMLKLVQRGKIDPAPLVTHRLHGLDKIGEGLNRMRDKPQDLIKVAVYNDQ